MGESRDTCWVWSGEWRAEEGARVSGVDILHISDLHLGQPRRAHARSLAKLVDQIPKLSPEVIVLSGDVAHFPDDVDAFSAARDAFLPLELPCLAIPGNHDLAAPYPAESMFDDYFGHTPRVEEIGALEVVLFDSFRFLSDAERSPEDRVRGLEGHYAHGAVTREQLELVEQQLSPRGDRHRVVVVHHHLHEHRSEVGRPDPSESDREQMRPLYDASALLDWCVEHDVDLILTGHQHAWTPPEQFRGIPNIRGTKSLAPHGVARLITFRSNGDIQLLDHRAHNENTQ